MGGFRYISILSIFSIIYITIVLLIELPFYLEYNYRDDRLVYYHFDSNTFSYFAITAFAFSCHMEFVQIVDEMAESNERRLSKVIFRSVFTNSLLYGLVAFTGYFSTYEETKNIVIERLPVPTMKTDLPMIIGRIMIIVVLCIAFPMNLVPMKKIIV